MNYVEPCLLRASVSVETLESLKAELPGVLHTVLPSLLDEALARGDALPQDGANLVVQAFREELPQALQKLLPEMLPDLLAEAKKGTTTGDGDGGAPAPSLTQEMLKDTMDQCLDEKWLTTRQGQQEDFDKVVQIASTAQLKKYLDKHKEVQQSVEALTKQVEALTQMHAQAGKTEQVRFQTLDGAVRSRIEVVETNVKSRIDLLSSDMVEKFQATETTQARLDVYVAKFEGLVEKLEAVPGRFTTATDRMEGIIRERATSVQGDLNKMAGEVSHANREHTGLVRRLTASTDSLQATVANMGAAMSQPTRAGLQKVSTSSRTWLRKWPPRRRRRTRLSRSCRTGLFHRHRPRLLLGNTQQQDLLRPRRPHRRPP